MYVRPTFTEASLVCMGLRSCMPLLEWLLKKNSTERESFSRSHYASSLAVTQILAAARTASRSTRCARRVPGGSAGVPASTEHTPKATRSLRTLFGLVRRVFGAKEKVGRRRVVS